MDAYVAFSKVYDKLMENVPYKTWADAIDKWIKEYGISKPCRNATDPLESERNLVLDMGCGTGTMTRLLYGKGYDMIGVDLSPEMLDVAREKSEDAGIDTEESEGILYLCQDMCKLDLYSTIGTVISSCDSINYLLEDDEILNCFKGVSKFLYPGGLFIFDFNTVHKFRDVIGDSTIAENDEDVSFIWENFFDDSDNVNECDLTLFIKNDAPDNMYIKEEETHYQRGYTLSEIRDFLARAGLDFIKAFDEQELVSGCKTELNEDSERIFVIAGKKK